MLKVHTHGLDPADDRGTTAATLKPPGPEGWIDLLDPTEDEIRAVEAATGLDLPNKEQLSEVEASSRLRRVGQALFISVPVIFRGDAGPARITPVGFIVSAEHFVTVRFEKLKAFESCRERVGRAEISHPSPMSTFLALLEAIVDRLADILEEVGADLDKVAEEVFGKDLDDKPTRRPKATDLKLRYVLRRVGRARQLASKVRATLLAIGRIVPYVESEAEEWMPGEARPRLETVRRDVDSLDEYEIHLSDKVQFLLDADLGLISIEQNDRFRILTVVSIIGIPPTFFASMYGMNFKTMPELDWQYGYPYALALLLASAIIPVVWFRFKGWL